MHQTQYLTFNTHQRHAGRILVSGDDCNAIGWRTKWFCLQPSLSFKIYLTCLMCVLNVVFGE